MDPKITFEEVEFSALAPDLQAHVNQLEAAQDDRFLYFKNATLVRAEVNKNRDEVSEEGLQELAATLPMTAIDLEHDHQKVIGFYTAARVLDKSLSTDGLIFKNRFPKEAEGVRDGSYLKSIEASADKAQCTECQKFFEGRAQYCEHLAGRTAVRKLFGLKAQGGAVTKRPAGTNTAFDANSIMLIASLPDEKPDDKEDDEDEDKSEDKKPFAEGAQRAAQRFMASVDLLTANPRSQTRLASPILAPLLWDPNEAQIKSMVDAAVKHAMSTWASSQTAQASHDLEASETKFGQLLESVRKELTDKLAAVEAAQEAIRSRLDANKEGKTGGVFGLGLSWLESSQQQEEPKPITWMPQQ